MPPTANRNPPLPPVDEPNALPSGTRFGELEILRTLGVGGFGIVYLARDHSLEREVAIKEYMPSQYALRHGHTHVSVRAASMQQTFEVGLRSFVNEARLLARFNHPSLLKVYRFWEAHGTAYMAMPYLQGQSLAEAATAQPTPPPEAWLRRVLTSVLDGLAVLHSQGVLHRDVAPDNIFLPADGAAPILLDFGAARQAIGDRTQTFTAILKPSYAPIEQYAEAQGLRQGPWSDLYALAAVMHHLLTGKPPPPAPARAMIDDYRPLAVPGYAPALLAALDWALRMPPYQRPQTAEALREVMDGLRPAPPPGTAAVPPPEPTASPPPPAEPVDLGFADTVQAPLEVDHPLLQPRDSSVAPARPELKRNTPKAAPAPAGAPTRSRKPALTTAPSRRLTLSRRLQLTAVAVGLALLALFVAQLKPAGSPPVAAVAADTAAPEPTPLAAEAASAASAPGLAGLPADPEPASAAAALASVELAKPKPVAALEAARPSKRPPSPAKSELQEGPPPPDTKAKAAPAPEPAPAVVTEAPPAEPKGPASPTEACAGRVLLGKLWCIDRQCETAKFQGHDECVRLRELREQRRGGQGQP